MWGVTFDPDVRVADDFSPYPRLFQRFSARGLSHTLVCLPSPFGKHPPFAPSTRYQQHTRARRRGRRRGRGRGTSTTTTTTTTSTSTSTTSTTTSTSDTFFVQQRGGGERGEGVVIVSFIISALSEGNAAADESLPCVAVALVRSTLAGYHRGARRGSGGGRVGGRGGRVRHGGPCTRVVVVVVLWQGVAGGEGRGRGGEGRGALGGEKGRGAWGRGECCSVKVSTCVVGIGRVR